MDCLIHKFNENIVYYTIKYNSLIDDKFKDKHNTKLKKSDIKIRHI